MSFDGAGAARLGALAVAVALAAGCGDTDPDRRAATSTVLAAAPRANLGPTDGRIGEATRISADGRPQRLSRGGRADPEPRPRKGVRGGVIDPAACPGDPSAAPTEGNLAAVAAITLCLINAERTERGLVGLTPNDRLADAARGHAGDMVARSYFAHDSPEGSSSLDRIRRTGYIPDSSGWIVGENLAWGSGALALPVAIHNAWMNSTGHRENLLNAEYREIGIGIVTGNPALPNGNGATYATEFGVKAGAGGGGGSSTAGTAAAGGLKDGGSGSSRAGTGSGGGTGGGGTWSGRAGTTASGGAAARARRACRSRRRSVRRSKQCRRAKTRTSRRGSR